MLNQGDIQRMSTEQDEDNNHPYLPPPPGDPPSSYYRDESPQLRETSHPLPLKQSLITSHQRGTHEKMGDLIRLGGVHTKS